MRYAGMEAGIASWWGQGSATDSRVPLLLQGASGTPFRWSLYYEREGSADPTVAQLSSDLGYIAANYGADPSYLRVDGKPVIFVYADGADACGMADRWTQANAQPLLRRAQGVPRLQDLRESAAELAPVRARGRERFAGRIQLRDLARLLQEGRNRAPACARPGPVDRERAGDEGEQRTVATRHDVQRVGRGHRGRVGAAMGELLRATAPISTPSTSISSDRYPRGHHRAGGGVQRRRHTGVAPEGRRVLVREPQWSECRRHAVPSRCRT